MYPKFPAFDHTDPEVVRERLRRALPPDHRKALGLVLGQGEPVYLVGGIVRDLLLGRENLDLDFVTLNPAVVLARHLYPLLQKEFLAFPVKLTEHPDFGTARLDIHPTLHLDLATARLEVYDHPAVLPRVIFPARLDEDLRRRDFTFNALALFPDGTLYDPFNGLADLRDGWLRILHHHSFVDDPTRMVRGVRFAARFGYHFDPATGERLREALAGGYFGLLSAERKRNELRLVLREDRPEKALALLQSLGLLAAIHPRLSWDEDLAKVFARLAAAFDYRAQVFAYLAGLVHRLGREGAAGVVKELRFSGLEADVPVEVADLWERTSHLDLVGWRNSQLYEIFHSYRPESVAAFIALLPDPALQTRLRRYQEEAAVRQPILNGSFLLEMGLAPGPRFKIWLAELRAAVLDGEISGREAEAAFLRARIQNS